MTSEARLRKFLGMNQMGPETYRSVKALKDPNLRDEEALMRSQKGDKPVVGSKKTDLEKMNAILGRYPIVNSPAQASQSIPKKSVQMEEQVIDEPKFAKPDLSQDEELVRDNSSKNEAQDEFENVMDDIDVENAMSELEKQFDDETAEFDRTQNRDWHNRMIQVLIQNYGVNPNEFKSGSYEDVKELYDRKMRQMDALEAAETTAFDMKQEKDKNRSPNKEQARNINDLKEELVGEFGVDAKTLSNKTYDQIKKMNESSWRARKGLEESLKSSTGGMFEDLQKQMKNRGQ